MVKLHELKDAGLCLFVCLLKVVYNVQDRDFKEISAKVNIFVIPLFSKACFFLFIIALIGHSKFKNRF